MSVVAELAGRLMRSRSCLGFVALLTALVMLSTMITGYRDLYGHNHAYQIVLVQKINNPSLYPNDAFAETVHHYASVFWYIVAFLSRAIDLSVLLLLLFLVNKVLFLVAGYRLTQALFPRSRYAPLLGMFLMATTPQLLFGGGYVTDYTQQTGFAIGFALLALDAFLRGRYFALMLWVGLAINMNTMFAIHVATYLVAAQVASLRSVQRLREAGVAAIGTLVVGSPGLYLVLRSATYTAYDSVAVWQATELSYPYHFFPQTWEVMRQLVMLALALGLLGIVRWSPELCGSARRHLVTWTVVAVSWYTLTWANVLLLRWVPLLHLHPVRALIFWQFIASLVVAGAVAAWVERRNFAFADWRFTVACVAVFFAVWWYRLLPPARLSLLLLMFPLVCEAARWSIGWLSHRMRLAIPTAAVILAIPLLYASAISVRGYWRKVQTAGNWLGMEIPVSSHFAKWARENTSPDAVFLIPIYGVNDWIYFRHLSARNVFTHAKDGTAWSYAPWFAGEWLARLKALGFYEVAGIREQDYAIGAWIHVWDADERNYRKTYELLNDEKVKMLSRKYRIDYWITSTRTHTSFPELYRFGEWKVLRVTNE